MRDKTRLPVRRPLSILVIKSSYTFYFIIASKKPPRQEGKAWGQVLITTSKYGNKMNKLILAVIFRRCKNFLHKWYYKYINKLNSSNN